MRNFKKLISQIEENKKMHMKKTILTILYNIYIFTKSTKDIFTFD